MVLISIVPFYCVNNLDSFILLNQTPLKLFLFNTCKNYWKGTSFCVYSRPFSIFWHNL